MSRIVVQFLAFITALVGFIAALIGNVSDSDSATWAAVPFITMAWVLILSAKTRR